MRLSLKFYLLLLTTVASGCSSQFEPKPTALPLGQSSLVSKTASISHVISIKKEDKLYICAMPAPDAVFQQGEDADFDLTLVAVGNNESAAVKESERSGEIEMLARTPAVLLAREIFYRTCEFSQNYNLTADNALEIYKKSLDVVLAFSLEEFKKTKISIGETQLLKNTSESIASVDVTNSGFGVVQANPPINGGNEGVFDTSTTGTSREIEPAQDTGPPAAFGPPVDGFLAPPN